MTLRNLYSVKAAALDAGMKQDMLSQLQVVEPALKTTTCIMPFPDEAGLGKPCLQTSMRP